MLDFKFKLSCGIGEAMINDHTNSGEQPVYYGTLVCHFFILDTSELHHQLKWRQVWHNPQKFEKHWCNAKRSHTCCFDPLKAMHSKLFVAKFFQKGQKRPKLVFRLNWFRLSVYLSVSQKKFLLVCLKHLIGINVCREPKKLERHWQS